jgi:hypothetical protein
MVRRVYGSGSGSGVGRMDEWADADQMEKEEECASGKLKGRVV